MSERELSCTMSRYRKWRSEFIRPPHGELPSAGLIRQVSEGAIAEVSEESKATCMFQIPVSMVTTYIDHAKHPTITRSLVGLII